MAGKKKFTPEQIIEAVVRTNGSLGEAATLLGCDAKTVYNYRDEFDEVAQAIDDARFNHDCETGDLAESKLRTLIEEGYWPAIKFALSTKFKSRGYTDKIEVEHSGTEVQQIRMFMDLRPDEADAMEQSNGRLESQ